MDALVLAGAVAQGAYTAGAISELFSPAVAARLKLNVRRIVGASSGALNGAFLARALREGDAPEAVLALEELWLEQASASNVFDVSLGAILQGRGVSTSKKLRGLLEKYILPSANTNPVELSVVVTNLRGDADVVASQPATTYERRLRFTGDTFDSEAKLSPLFDAVVASAAFPILFEPATIRGGSSDIPCVDGGACNDTPIGYALEGAPEIDRVFVIAPFPRVRTDAPATGGASLITELAQILVEERLFRDVQEADRVNRALLRLERSFPIKSFRSRILEAIGWTDRRVVQIVEIRPSVALTGNVFSGFLSKRLRAAYLSAGHEAALEAVLAMGEP